MKKPMNRRTFLKCVVLAGAGALPRPVAAGDEPKPVRIAFLHLSPAPGDLTGNRAMIDNAVAAAAEAGATVILTPELCVSGYAFAEVIGTDWIRPQPDAWTQVFCGKAAKLGVTVFLSMPERDPRTGKLHNAVFAIGPDGAILGRHRKIRTIRVGHEAWSSPGDAPAVIRVPPFGEVGMMICADAYTPRIARQLRSLGARVLISPANWAPGEYGPAGVWEQCTKDTGLPLLVCNRTGVDGLDFREAKSVVAKDGGRLFSKAHPVSAVFLIDWDVKRQRPMTRPPRVIPLPIR
jgi:5-aminopentanamidase